MHVLVKNMSFNTNLCTTCNSISRYLFTVFIKTTYTYSTRRKRLAHIWKTVDKPIKIHQQVLKYIKKHFQALIFVLLLHGDKITSVTTK